MALDDLSRRAAGWTLTRHGFKALSGGLRKSWADGQLAMGPALRRPDPERLHAWRKRVKDHWYQAQLLAGIWPAAMAARIAAADRLGTRLGDYQDLAVLTGRLDPASPAAQAILALARHHRAAILAEVAPLGRRLYADRPGPLGRRWHRWWREADPALPVI